MNTIAAISTAPGAGGIGIIRMSGQDCFAILEKIFRPYKNEKIEEIKGYHMKYGYIVDKEIEEVVDEVLVSFFKAPKSYTTENMCEINSHGGPVVMRRILELCLKNGAEMAEPGEFTKRAFLNGRIDLTQAESIIDIIQSKTEKEAKASAAQLTGCLSKEIKKIRDNIMEVMVDIEASIDYPEYDVEEVSEKQTAKMLRETKISLEKLKDTFQQGKIIKEGIKAVILGKPNVGKSSLLNAMLKEDRAIVTDIEGTTRDTIEEFIEIKGIPLKLIDTAGIRQAKDKVEQLGITKSKELVGEADLVIAMLDSSQKLTKEDEEILDLIKDKKAILILNKSDLKPEIEKEKLQTLKKPIIEISALKKEGIEKLADEIERMFQLNEIQVNDSVFVTNIRHKNMIQKALVDTEKAMDSLQKGLPIDMVAIPIKDILEDLGNITGESVSDNIIQEIFAKFCLGK